MRSLRVDSSGGVELAVHDLGGRGEPLLIAHATGFCGRAYDPLSALLRRQFHVFAIDLRGHGDSTSPADGDFGWSGMADDVLATNAVIGRGPIGAIGHSMGGAALLLAEAARPGTLRFAYLYEPILFPSGFVAYGDNAMAGPARRRRARFASKAEVLHRYANRPPLNVLRADALAAYVEHGFMSMDDGTVRLKCTGEHEARTYDAGLQVTVDRIAGVTVPTTVAVGLRTSGTGPERLAPGIVAALGSASLLEYPHLGHFGPLQDPESLVPDVLALALAAAPAAPG
ncbi:MAG: alpha/beta fold hydrolase [Acidimicrobiales bacterium]